MKYSTSSLFGAAASALSIYLFAASSLMATGTQAVPFTIPEVLERGIGKGDIRNHKAPQELVMFSIPEGMDLAEAKGQYAYDHSAGKGVDVYVIDTGALISHKEFTTGKKAAERARWIFTNPEADSHKDDGNYQVLDGRVSGKCHGTGMLDKVVGTEYGVSKKINPVIVKVPGERHTGSNPTRDEYLRGVELTLNDIKGKENPANSVVSMSWYYPNEIKDPKTGESIILPDEFKDKMKEYISEMISLGATVVVASGNDGVDTMDGYPAVLAQDIDDLIVVGAIDYSGARWKSTSGSGSNLDANLGLPHVYAVGAANAVNGIAVANCIPNGVPVHTPPGTSPATASVAGLAAYFKGHPGFKTDSPTEVKTLIVDHAYARGSDDTLKAVWNGITPKSGTCTVQRDASSNYTDCLPLFEDSGMAKLF